MSEPSPERFHVEVHEGADHDRMRILDGGTPLSRLGLFQALRDDVSFRAFFLRAVRAVRFEAFFWETPALLTRTAALDAEMVFIPAPQLGRLRADPRAFAAQLKNESVAVFPNLGQDAVLLVPAPSEGKVYPHLATFVRSAPEIQQDLFVQRLGAAVTARVSERPVWVSTAGLGVAWLHVRLDDRPKYYRHAPYREAA